MISTPLDAISISGGEVTALELMASISEGEIFRDQLWKNDGYCAIAPVRTFKLQI